MFLLSVWTNSVVTQIRQRGVVVSSRVLSGIALSVKLLRRVTPVAMETSDFIETTGGPERLVHRLITRVLARYNLLADLVDAKGLRLLVRDHVSELASDVITRPIGSQTE